MRLLLDYFRAITVTITIVAVIPLKALFPKEGAPPANTVPTQLSGFEDREMPSFFLEPGIQPPSHWPCQRGCCHWDSEPREVGTLPLCCQHWHPLGGLPQPGHQCADSTAQVSLLTLQQHTLVSRHLSGSRTLHRHIGCPQHPSNCSNTQGLFDFAALCGMLCFHCISEWWWFPTELQKKCCMVMGVIMVCDVSFREVKGLHREKIRESRTRVMWVTGGSLSLVAFRVWHRSEERFFHGENSVWPGSWCS